MKSILCATDFSPNALHALQYCLEFAYKIKAKVFLLHTYESPVAFTEMPMTAILDADEQIKSAAEKKLVKLKSNAATKFPGVSVESFVEQGPAPEIIVKLADKMDVDLIVIGKTGTGKVERLLIGSTASKVIQHANCSVLCIPKGLGYNPLKKIVFSTDLQEDNLNASGELVDFAKIFHSEIIFLFVDDKHMIHSDAAIEEMTKKIRDRVKYPKISGYICKNNSVTNGIEYFLKHHSADLLSMFTHKKKFPESLFHPSLTKAMASKTGLPLLVLERSERVVMT